MEIVVSVLLGVGLAAACGFRVFIPLLATAVAARAGLVTLNDAFSWVDNAPAIVALAAATVLEVGAYYIPWVDNLLDTVATPVAVMAGVLVSASVMTGMDPALRWGVAVIAGGGVSGTIQIGTSLLRALSTATTGGLGNPVVSSAEAGGALTLSVLALVIPVVAGLAALLLLVVIARRIGAWRRRRRERRGPGPA